ncbi:MAG: DUF2007 domain-containing protein [Bacteroidia bacterium]
MTLITLKTFDNAFEAHLLRSKLESEGIECYVFDENSVTLNPLYNITLGGIKVKIKKDDLEAAEKIIEEVERTPVTGDNNEVISCPRCGSTEFYTRFRSMKGVVGIISGIFSFLFAVFPIYFKNVKKCKSCGNEFK